ncbi:ClpXP protease specificity-enhancing factor [Hydrogenophaga sp.]|uniref:ClpXP protease specificity-enhancing factor n=1 Tax=Hydrogenophaga sp. TaxID=1904254 RepID=UPI002728559A|nr:ClpXP protease specificity-enhancing factor [Hydrogenophaga sp.]MDO8903288.1 ClpXP protease specificity-enhancing factor [Hydrogenophaga sp.]
MSALDTSSSSTRPYLIRALHEWCTDNGFSPYIAVQVDGSVQVPGEFVQNGEIVLNVSFDATSSLRLGNDCIEFKARFGGVAREIVVPISHVVAIYARENGQGMAFPAPSATSTPGDSQRMGAAEPSDPSPTPDSSRALLRSVPSDESAGGPLGETPEPPTDGPPRPGGRPKLKRVK